MTEFARPSPGGASFSTEPGRSEVAVVGAGRVGCSIGRALAIHGHRIVAAATADPAASARRVREALGDVPVTTAADAPLGGDIVVIAVPDDALAAVVDAVAGNLKPGAVVVHTSGLHGARTLGPCGPNVAAIHPAQAVPSPSTDLRGVWFGVTCPDEMREWSEWFVAQLGGIPLHVPEEARPRYHAALAMASNFAVALAGDAGDLLPDPGVLGPLLRGTVENVIALGADAALTGPVVRGDAGTIREHLRALPPHLIEPYVVNARRVLGRAVASGRLSQDKASAVRVALDEVLVP